MSIIGPIIVLGVLIVVHEFGHFIVAKWCGVGVVKFSVGFGPALIKKRVGETTYQLSLIPLGGYVRMIGDVPDMITGPQLSDEEVRKAGTEDDKRSEDEKLTDYYGLERQDINLLKDHSRWFIEKGLIPRSLIVAAGPFFNFFLAVALIFLSVVIYGEEYVDEARIARVMDGSPAGAAGMREGDLVTKIDDAEIKDWKDLERIVSSSEGKALIFTLQRGLETLALEIQPKVQERPSFDGDSKKVYMIGVGPVIKNKDASIWDGIVVGTLWTVRASEITVKGLWGLISGKLSAKELAGPLFIIGEAGRQAERGFDSLLIFMAQLSVSLAILNLLPIPILDGGHLLFFLIEALLGPVNIEKRERAQQVGMLLLFLLMGFAIYNDISREPIEMNKSYKWQESEKK